MSIQIAEGTMATKRGVDPSFSFKATARDKRECEKWGAAVVDRINAMVRASGIPKKELHDRMRALGCETAESGTYAILNGGRPFQANSLLFFAKALGVVVSDLLPPGQ